MFFSFSRSLFFKILSNSNPQTTVAKPGNPTCLELLIIRCILGFFARVAYRYHSHGTVTDSLNSSLGSNHDNLQLHDPLKDKPWPGTKSASWAFLPSTVPSPTRLPQHEEEIYLFFLFFFFPSLFNTQTLNCKAWYILVSQQTFIVILPYPVQIFPC